jgi:glycine/D-amino acid oxidase-like deaminating enzyme
MMAARSALVIGAGLAGHAMAYALAKRQWSVQLLDGDHPDSSGGSWQPVIAQHPSVTPDDAPMSRLWARWAFEGRTHGVAEPDDHADQFVTMKGWKAPR